ncbi:MAG: hypothetical protein Q8784_02480 [Vigna little leaf phytoplasma]|nr:hypothetical protein [Vigna little leaf phytoplasma]
MITVYYVIKFYLLTLQLSLYQLKQGIVVRFYRYLTTKNSKHHVASI